MCLLFYVRATSLFYLLSMGYDFVNNCYWLYLDLQQFRPEHVSHLVVCILSVILYLFCIIVFILIIMFYQFHVRLVKENKTTIENIEHKNEEFQSRYDMGEMHNYQQVYGTNRLLDWIPIMSNSSLPKGRGLKFEANCKSEDSDDNDDDEEKQEDVRRNRGQNNAQIRRISQPENHRNTQEPVHEPENSVSKEVYDESPVFYGTMPVQSNNERSTIEPINKINKIDLDQKDNPSKNNGDNHNVDSFVNPPSARNNPLSQNHSGRSGEKFSSDNSLTKQAKVDKLKEQFNATSESKISKLSVNSHKVLSKGRSSKGSKAQIADTKVLNYGSYSK